MVHVALTRIGKCVYKGAFLLKEKKGMNSFYIKVKLKIIILKQIKSARVKINVVFALHWMTRWHLTAAVGSAQDTFYNNVLIVVRALFLFSTTK